MTWYMTAKPYHVSALCFEVRDTGGADWSHQHCTSPAFGRVMIFLTSFEHLTLAVTSHGSPHGMGVLGYLVYPWPINGGLPTV